jgi:hypothetical protein
VSWQHGAWLRQVVKSDSLKGLSVAMASRADSQLSEVLFSLERGLQPVLLMREHGVGCLARCVAQLLLGQSAGAEALLSLDAVVDKATLELPTGAFRSSKSKAPERVANQFSKARMAIVDHPVTLTASLRLLRSAVTQKQVLCSDVCLVDCSTVPRRLNACHTPRRRLLWSFRKLIV